MNKESDKRIAAAFDSLNGLQRASANPHTYTRVYAKIREEQGPWGITSRWLARPVIALAICLLLIGINAWIIIDARNAAIAAKAEQAEEVAITYHIDALNSTDNNFLLP